MDIVQVRVYFPSVNLSAEVVVASSGERTDGVTSTRSQSACGAGAFTNRCRHFALAPPVPRNAALPRSSERQPRPKGRIRHAPSSAPRFASPHAPPARRVRYRRRIGLVGSPELRLRVFAGQVFPHPVRRLHAGWIRQVSADGRRVRGVLQRGSDGGHLPRAQPRPGAGEREFGSAPLHAGRAPFAGGGQLCEVPIGRRGECQLDRTSLLRRLPLRRRIGLSGGFRARRFPTPPSSLRVEAPGDSRRSAPSFRPAATTARHPPSPRANRRLTPARSWSLFWAEFHRPDDLGQTPSPPAHDASFDHPKRRSWSVEYDGLRPHAGVRIRERLILAVAPHGAGWGVLARLIGCAAGVAASSRAGREGVSSTRRSGACRVGAFAVPRHGRKPGDES